MPFLAPIGAAIGAAFTAASTFLAAAGATLIGKALISIGLNIGMALIQRALFPQPKPQSGVNLDLTVGGDQPRLVLCGRFASGGHQVYENSYGPSNKYLQIVRVLSDYPITSVTALWIDGIQHTLGAAHAVRGRVVAGDSDYAGLMWVDLYDGTQTEASVQLVENANPPERWTEDHVGVGIAYVVITIEYDRERTGRVPDIVIEGEGAPAHDFREDEAEGGEGDQLFADASTHTFTENPVVIERHYRRGFSVNGDLFCGMGQSVNELPVTRWAAAANVCDEIVDGAPRYRVSAGFVGNAEHGDAITTLMQSCAGLTINGVDTAWPMIGTTIVPVATLTEADIADGDEEFAYLRATDRLINTVAGTFPDPANGWKPKDYTTAQAPEKVVLDRRERPVRIDFPQVPYARQAAQLAAIALSENRFEGEGRLTLKPEWQSLEPGDCIVLDTQRHGTRTWLITSAAEQLAGQDKPGSVAVSLQERSSDIYTSVGVVTPPAVNPAQGEPVRIEELANFAVTASQATGDSGQIVPALRAAWGIPEDPDVTGVIIEYRRQADPGTIFEHAVTFPRSVALITSGVVSATLYEVRHRIVTDPPRPVTPSAWIEVTTGEARNTDITVTLAVAADDVQDVLAGLRSRADDIFAELAALAEAQAVATGAQEIRQIVSVQRANALAAAQQVLSARVDSTPQVFRQADAPDASGLPDGCIWFDTDELNKTYVTVDEQWVDTSTAGMTVFEQEEQPTTAVVGALWFDTDDDNRLYRWTGSEWSEVADQRVTALAEALTAVQAQADDATAGGLFKIEAQAGSGNVLARAVAYVRATLNDDFEEAGWLVEVVSEGNPPVLTSRFVVNANQFAVTDGTSTAVPLVFENGELVAEIARFREAVAERFVTANGKAVFGTLAPGVEGIEVST
jgi:hypothetical protein